MTNKELQTEIAKLRGWTNIQADIYNPDWLEGQKDGRGEVDVPNWPKYVSAAWELVEEIVDREFEFEVRHSVGIMGYICTIETPGHHYPKVKYICIREDTAPRAICLAWLAWKKAQA